MKRIACMMLFMLFMLFATALCEQPVPCYWQLSAVEVETSASDAFNTTASTDALPLSGLDAEGMFRALPSSFEITTAVARPGSSTGSQGSYTFSGLPALAPGAASTRLLLSASMPQSSRSLYLYATVSVNGQRLLRVRDSGAWMLRIPFPRQAEPGAVREVRLHAAEINGRVDVNVVCRYEAVPGTMLIDVNGDIVLYDLQGHETTRISADGVAPAFADAGSGADMLLSAQVLPDGSLAALISPACGLSPESLSQLLLDVLASGAGSGTSAQGMLDTDGLIALFIPAGMAPDEAALTALLEAIPGLLSGSQEDASAGSATPAASTEPLSYSELLSALKSTATPAAETPVPEAAHTPQGFALYSGDGVQTVVLMPGASLDRSTLESIAAAFARLQALGLSANELTAQFSQQADAASFALTPLSDATLLTVYDGGDASLLLSHLNALLTTLAPEVTAAPAEMASTTPAATPTATPTAAPTATPTAAPTATPTAAPTATPTTAPTAAPTATPTTAPTATPTTAPTATPTAAPTAAPTATPTIIPTASPEDVSTPIPTDYAGSNALLVWVPVFLLIAIIFGLLVAVLMRMNKKD